jgi:hypothetical protein
MIMFQSISFHKFFSRKFEIQTKRNVILPRHISWAYYVIKYHSYMFRFKNRPALGRLQKCFITNYTYWDFSHFTIGFSITTEEYYTWSIKFLWWLLKEWIFTIS